MKVIVSNKGAFNAEIIQAFRAPRSYRHAAMLHEFVFGCTAHNRRNRLYPKHLFGLFCLVFGRLCHFVNCFASFLEESAAYRFVTRWFSDSSLLHHGVVVYLSRPKRSISRLFHTPVRRFECAMACTNADKGGLSW